MYNQNELHSARGHAAKIAALVYSHRTRPKIIPSMVFNQFDNLDAALLQKLVFLEDYQWRKKCVP